MPAEVATVAPDFALPNQDCESVGLRGQFRHGPVVLAFVPAAFSRVCTKEVIQQYGVVDDNLFGLKGTAKRAVFLIDRKGVVRYREVLNDAREKPDYDRLKQAIASL